MRFIDMYVFLRKVFLCPVYILQITRNFAVTVFKHEKVTLIRDFLSLYKSFKLTHLKLECDIYQQMLHISYNDIVNYLDMNA